MTGAWGRGGSSALVMWNSAPMPRTLARTANNDTAPHCICLHPAEDHALTGSQLGSRVLKTFSVLYKASHVIRR